MLYLSCASSSTSSAWLFLPPLKCSTFPLPTLRMPGLSGQQEKLSSHQITSNFSPERWFAMAIFSKQRMRMYACISMAMEILYFTSFSTYLPELHLKDAVASITTFGGHTLSTSAIDIPTIQTSPVSNSSLQPASSENSAVHSTEHTHRRSLIGAVSNTTLGVSSPC